MAESLSNEDQEETNMFDCVWVKLEKNDESFEEEMNEEYLDEKCLDEHKNLSSSELVNTNTIAQSSNNDTSFAKRPRKKQPKKRPEKILYCQLCSYTTVYKNCLDIHMMGTHSDLKPYKCTYCDYSTKYPLTLQRHVTIMHRENEVAKGKTVDLLSCDLCDYTNYSKWNLKAHKRKHETEKRFKCTECNFETSYKHNLLKHAKSHSDPAMFKCHKCAFETRFEGHIMRHLTQVHHEDVGLTNVCDVCDFSTKEKWRLTLHKQRNKTEFAIHCANCDFQSFYKCEARKHNQTHFAGFNKPEVDISDTKVPLEIKPVFKCEKCEFQNKSEGLFYKHLADVHNETTQDNINIYSCEFCEYSSREAWRLKYHQRKNLSEIPLECEYCGFKTLHRCQSKKHKHMHFSDVHGSNELYDNNAEDAKIKNLVSNFINTEAIDKAEQTEATAKEDDVVESGETSQDLDLNSVEVPNCLELETEFSNKSDLNQTKHGKDNNYLVDPECVDWHNIQVLETDAQSSNGRYLFQCHLCDYGSKFKASVQRHFQRHHTSSGNKPYKCINCSFCTKTKDQIALHNRRSKSDKELSCKSCEYKTSFKCAYTDHQKEHYEFKCNYCEYSCRTKYDLSKHFSIQHLDFKVKCRFCDYKTGRKESLVYHEAIHTGKKPYKCQECDYTSVRRCTVQYHFQKYHGLKSSSGIANGVVNDGSSSVLSAANTCLNES